MQTEYGIDATCRGASALGYQVTLVRQGHSTYDADDLPAAEVIVRHNVSIGTFAAVIESDAIDFRQGSGRGS